MQALNGSFYLGLWQMFFFHAMKNPDIHSMIGKAAGARPLRFRVQYSVHARVSQRPVDAFSPPKTWHTARYGYRHTRSNKQKSRL